MDSAKEPVSLKCLYNSHIDSDSIQSDISKELLRNLNCITSCAGAHMSQDTRVEVRTGFKESVPPPRGFWGWSSSSYLGGQHFHPLLAPGGNLNEIIGWDLQCDKF